MTIKKELSISIILTIAGLCLISYFLVFLNARLTTLDFSHPIYTWTEFYEAIPYGAMPLLWGMVLIFIGLILNIVALIRKPRTHQTYPSPPPSGNVPTCPTCGGPLTYINQYQRWYCPVDKKYV